MACKCQCLRKASKFVGKGFCPDGHIGPFDEVAIFLDLASEWVDNSVGLMVTLLVLWWEHSGYWWGLAGLSSSGGIRCGCGQRGTGKVFGARGTLCTLGAVRAIGTLRDGIDDHDVFAAAAGCDGETAGLVTVDLAGDGNRLHVHAGGVVKYAPACMSVMTSS
jgi:hypothetical protein